VQKRNQKALGSSYGSWCFGHWKQGDGASWHDLTADV
jgi:hypothetical protein